MSTKDNWDDESSDEEGDLPPGPLKGELLCLPPDPLKGDTPPGPLYQAQFANNEEDPPEEDDPEEGGVGEDPP